MVVTLGSLPRESVVEMVTGLQRDQWQRRNFPIGKGWTSQPTAQGTYFLQTHLCNSEEPRMI